MLQLRKTLGDIHSETCSQLMRLIETQSKATLSRWAIGYAREHYLPIGRDACPDLESAVIRCQACAEAGSPAQCKDQIRTAAALARSCQGPAEQAAARAVAVACAVIQTPSNALGFLFYGAAAVAYAEGGLNRSRTEYDAMAADELCRAYSSLCSCSVAGERNPVKVRWNC